jgi:NAD(P)-dependent dehydrogenase (short-subunit alcohol dehydrogenase family)
MMAGAGRSDAFAGRRVLITGASRGIAAEIALGIAARGGTVILNHSADADARAGKPQAAEALARRFADVGGAAEIIECDLATPGAGTLLGRAARAAGPVDSLVLSASVQVHRQFLRQEPEDVARQISMNLTANIELLQDLMPGMARRGFGRILAIGSVQERTPSAEMPIYSMTKAALANLFENLALQAGPDGITLNTLSPGLVETDRNAFRRKDTAEWERVCRRANPMGRAGQPSEMVAPALLFLSAEAAFVTGATLYATGGSHVRSFSDGMSAGLALPEETTDAAG